jgi:hypothetical protein
MRPGVSLAIDMEMSMRNGLLWRSGGSPAVRTASLIHRNLERQQIERARGSALRSVGIESTAVNDRKQVNADSVRPGCCGLGSGYGLGIVGRVAPRPLR